MKKPGGPLRIVERVEVIRVHREETGRLWLSCGRYLNRLSSGGFGVTLKQADTVTGARTWANQAFPRKIGEPRRSSA